jgi:outer membrane protein
MKTSFKSILAFAFVGLFAASVQAQPAPKVYVIDLAKLYDGHFKTDEQNAKLRTDEQKAQEQLQQLNTEGNALVKEFQELQEQIKNPALSADAKTKAEKETQAKAEDIQRKQNEVRGFTENTQRALRQRIGTFRQILLEEISKTATEIAKRKGATLLIDKSGPSAIGVSNILYFDAAYDITEEVAKEINKDRPAGAPAAPAAPAAKPTAGAPATSGDAPSVSFPGAKK